MIEFYLDTSSGVATYLQLVHQVRQALRLGVLQAGDRLPTAREVVSRLAINPNTVLKAYRELEREGLVRPRPGLGTFVVGLPAGPDPRLRQKYLRSMTRWVTDARASGLDAEDIEAIFRSAVRDALAEGVA